MSRPTIRGLFPKGTDVYVLGMGSTPLGYETRLRKPNGEIVSEPASKTSSFVGRFRRDGTYTGSVPLELPFKALQLGVFDNGDFLITGIDSSTSEPRAAIVASNGQLRRLLELKGDVHPLDDSSPNGPDRDPTALPRNKPWRGFAESLRDVVFTSQIAEDNRSLLLFRPSSGPVFSISPSGEVRARKLRIEGTYRLFTIKRARDSWIVEYIHDVPGSAAQEFSTYEFDPGDSRAKREYFFPTDLGWGLACADGDEFTFIVADEKAGMLKLVKLAPQGRAR
ncbi:MAG: hypothetical protein WAL56_16260 [Candidatus Sulfotelmatobacter sp.]